MYYYWFMPANFSIRNSKRQAVGYLWLEKIFMRKRQREMTV